MIEGQNGLDAGQRVDMHEPDEKRERELEVRVAARTQELSSLSTHLLRLGETERATLAKELHDELGGLITAAKMDMSWLAARLSGALDAECRDKLDSVMQMLNQAMVLKRRVVENLRPSLLDHFGLSVALRSHFDEHCQRAGIECVATLPEEVLSLDPVAQLTLFRGAGGAREHHRARWRKEYRSGIEPDGDGYVPLVGDDGPRMDTDLARSCRACVIGSAAGGRVEAEARPDQNNQIRAFVRDLQHIGMS